jgi:hypothetical protein
MDKMSGDEMRKKPLYLGFGKHNWWSWVGAGEALDEAALRLLVEFPSSFIWFPDMCVVLEV